MTPQERIKELEHQQFVLCAQVEETRRVVEANMEVIRKGLAELQGMLESARAERDALLEERRHWRQCCGKCGSLKEVPDAAGSN